MKSLRFLFVFFLILGLWSLVTSPSFAANPWFVDTATKTGKPARWPYEGTRENGFYTIYWFSDPGALNAKYDNPTAVKMIQELFEKWVDVDLKRADGQIIHTAMLKFEWCGNLNKKRDDASPGCKNNGYTNITDIKVDPGTNDHRGVNDYRQFAFPDMVNPPPVVIIFDEDGSIITDYMQGDATAKNGVVGLGHNTPGSDTLTIKTGFVILNGRMVNGNPVSTNDNEVPLDNFKAAILHEIGHLLNLDHSQLNMDVAQNCTGDSCPQSEGITTMFPFLFPDKTAPQLSLHNDDKTAVSYLYPSQNFINNFCVIEGDIVDPADKGIQGINVTTKNMTDNPLIDSRSWVSGALYPSFVQNGHYIFPGILPNQNYEVDYEQINARYRDPAQPASAVGPLLGDKAPKDFPPGQIEGQGNTQTVHCSHGGETISMPAYKMDLASTTPGESSTPPGNAAQTTSSSKKGFCSLNKSQPFSWGTFLGFLLILFIPLSFYRRPQ
ncbi:MAG: hypothetical protein HY877_07150 [Deltaproteobacteria bacterium]|nr:hypothetical protein [Deltaproteobacteria bacterium]